MSFYSVADILSAYYVVSIFILFRPRIKIAFFPGQTKLHLAMAGAAPAVKRAGKNQVVIVPNVAKVPALTVRLKYWAVSKMRTTFILKLTKPGSSRWGH